MTQQRTFKVFIASPNDVRDLREIVKQIVIDFDRTTKDQDIHVDYWAWEEDAINDYHADGAQPSIDEQIRTSDALIAIFGPSLGGSLPDGESGTQHEVRVALECRRTAETPRVIVCFPDPPPPSGCEQARRRWAEVERFREEIRDRVLYVPYTDSKALERRIRQQVGKMLFRAFKDQSPGEARSAALAWAASAASVMTRSEGITEPVGRVSIAFTGGTPRSKGGIIQEINIRLLATANITNWSSKNGLTDAWLLVFDENGTSVRCIVPGCLISDDCIQFSRIPLEPPGPNRSSHLEIVNVRIDVESRGDCATFYGKIEISPVGIPRLGLLSVNELVVLADSRPALIWTIEESSVSQKLSVNERLTGGGAEATFSSVLRIREGFPGAFRTLRQEATWANGIYASDAIHMYPGTADCGTRFFVRFKGIPDGNRVFVSECNLPGEGSGFGAGAAHLVAADCCGDIDRRCQVPRAVTIIDGVPAVELDGAWSAVWELTEERDGMVDAHREICFGIAVAAKFGAAGLGCCTVNCVLAPLSTVHRASSDSTVPRFIDTGVDQNLSC